MSNDYINIDSRNYILENVFQKNKLMYDIKNSNMTQYLPKKNENETDAEYAERINNAYFLNKIDKNINIFCSKPFKQDFKINSDNLEISDLARNFTGTKITATDFLKSVLNYALWFSQAHVFVDLSKKKKQLVSLLELSEIRDFSYDDEGELSYLRFRTEEQVREGLEIKRYKVIKEYYKTESGEVYWNDYISQEFSSYLLSEDFSSVIASLNYTKRTDNAKFGLDKIPLVSFYPIPNLSPFQPNILFKNAADIQLILFKTASRMKNSEHLLTTPTQVWKGVEIDDEEERIVVYSEKRGISLTEGSIEWLKPPVEILSSLQSNCDVLSNQIDDLMGDVLYGKTNGTSTATQSILNSSNTNNFLASIANSLQWTAEHVINLIIEWRNILNNQYETSITTDFTVAPDANKVNNLINLKTNNIISSKTVFEECRNMSLFNPDATWDDEQKEILEETASNFESFDSVTDVSNSDQNIINRQEENIDNFNV